VNILAEHLRYAPGGTFDSPREIVRDLSLRVGTGECLGVIGREGSGKTTLLNLLGGLIAPSSGSVIADGVNMHADTPAARDVRRKIGFTFQFPEEQFLSATVEEEFASLFRLRGIPETEWADRRRASLRAAGLDAAADGQRSPFSLSLGESRRLALALIGAIRPAAAFLDEPTSGLDAQGAASAGTIVRDLLRRGTTVLMATHDLGFAAGVTGRVIVLGDGGIAAEGTAAAVLGDAALLAAHGYSVPRRVAGRR